MKASKAPAEKEGFRGRGGGVQNKRPSITPGLKRHIPLAFSGGYIHSTHTKEQRETLGGAAFNTSLIHILLIHSVQTDGLASAASRR